jgi:hypothetical protein
MVHTNISEQDISRITWNPFQTQRDPTGHNVVQCTVLKSDTGQVFERTTYSLR